jgi:hypothetical protein
MSLGFDKVKKQRPALDIKGIQSMPPVNVSPDDDAKVIKGAEQLGFKSREANPEPKTEEDASKQGRGVIRQRSREPQREVFIKGPSSVIDRFVEYTNRSGYKSYWQALEALLSNEDVLKQ